jgi:hypothetical protein
MPDILPGFEYGRSSNRYRDLSTGRFVARSDVMDLLETQTSGLERRLGALTQAMQEGNLAPGYFADQVRTELRRAHLQERALGAGGWDRLTQADYGSTGRRLRDDYARIVNLAQGIQDGTVTLPQALNRIQGYAGSARLEFYEAQRQRMQAEAGEVLIMIRDLGASEHCEDCLGYYAQGWQFDLPSPCVGSICSTHCRCDLRLRSVASDAAAELLGTRRG